MLATSGCDLLAIETIPGIKEIKALFVLLEKYPKDAYLTMVSCANGVGKLNSGETWEEALKFIKENKPKSLKGIGVNCTKVGVMTNFLLECLKLKAIYRNLLTKNLPKLNFFSPILGKQTRLLIL